MEFPTVYPQASEDGLVLLSVDYFYAAPTTLQKLETEQNTALRIMTGALKSSPIPIRR